ncbi:MAG: hypothetical protein LRY73_10985 [Bacillus sp. (in: Bacteria)]|nr:hypothetical protein [Bacillus sp. (in: firmicutes)]
MFAVDFKNVLKRYANGTEMKVLFEDMNFHVNEGELIVISGEEKNREIYLAANDRSHDTA